MNTARYRDAIGSMRYTEARRSREHDLISAKNKKLFSIEDANESIQGNNDFGNQPNSC